ncbi:hypothetical protein IscW_ISCW009284 [Ixodes scapularis]|uniref:Uncharacterized protein n=1 Tax=Ixodes scapularis TaxID=6945 RepID=B7PX70_IXOSC|nr:hypothetical protein IscW_ISCW009284 [Ixodes scapularis]|eukprot:XP_002399505.1 hypothetical protein IscW_ISCW009284 [Ixodes scapularis]
MLLFQQQPEGAEISMVVYAGAVNILRHITQKDLNPADVRDLRVDNVTVDGKNITATLSWTCMGAHLDSGRVSNIVQLDWDTSSGGSVVDHTEAHPPPAVRTTALPRTVAPAAPTPYTVSTPAAELKGQDEKSSSGLLLGAVLICVVVAIVTVALYALMSGSGVVEVAASHGGAESGDDESTVLWEHSQTDME